MHAYESHLPSFLHAKFCRHLPTPPFFIVTNDYVLWPTHTTTMKISNSQWTLCPLKLRWRVRGYEPNLLRITMTFCSNQKAFSCNVMWKCLLYCASTLQWPFPKGLEDVIIDYLEMPPYFTYLLGILRTMCVYSNPKSMACFLNFTYFSWQPWRP